MKCSLRPRLRPVGIYVPEGGAYLPAHSSTGRSRPGGKRDCGGRSPNPRAFPVVAAVIVIVEQSEIPACVARREAQRNPVYC